MAGAFFAGAFFAGAFFAGAFFAGAFFAGAFFAGAFFAGAFFAGAFFAGAFFAGAFLAGAFLAGAFLTGAFFAGAFFEATSVGVGAATSLAALFNVPAFSRDFLVALIAGVASSGAARTDLGAFDCLEAFLVPADFAAFLPLGRFDFDSIGRILF